MFDLRLCFCCCCSGWYVLRRCSCTFSSSTSMSLFLFYGAYTVLVVFTLLATVRLSFFRSNAYTVDILTAVVFDVMYGVKPCHVCLSGKCIGRPTSNFCVLHFLGMRAIIPCIESVTSVVCPNVARLCVVVLLAVRGLITCRKRSRNSWLMLFRRSNGVRRLDEKFNQVHWHV